MDFDTEKFIIEIQNRPAIWNAKCADYSDRNVKQREWEGVVNVYGAELSSDEKKKLGINLQKKWRNIRDCFVKAHKAKETRTGSAAKRKNPYVFYDNLTFLKDAISVSAASKVTADAVEANEEALEESASNVALSPASRPPKNNKLNKHHHDVGGSKSKKLSGRHVEENGQEEDGDRLFFMSLVEEFKKIPRNRAIQAKIDILKVIKEAQFSDHPNMGNPSLDWTRQNNPHYGYQMVHSRHVRSPLSSVVSMTSRDSDCNDLTHPDGGQEDGTDS